MSEKKITKSDLSNIAIIGSGPTSLYLIQHIWDHIQVFKDTIKKITIFEKQETVGMGMPYSPHNTDIYNLSNISSEEIPMLQETFGNWLRKQSYETLQKLNVKTLPIDDTKVYSRIALGYYFHQQFEQLISAIQSTGIHVVNSGECEVIDISQHAENDLIITDCYSSVHAFTTAVIATGHEWDGEDKIESGYYASPWPIHKLLPNKEELYNFTIGTLGASLSAFDVVTSLSHRHGEFVTVDNKLKFVKHDSAPNFKIVLHSSKGWLPHLQYEQQEPIREIYRHFTRNQLLELIDDRGFLRIENFFDKLCRPILIAAFKKDKLFDVVEMLKDETFSFKDLVTFMSEKHEYVNSFEGMRTELIKAEKYVRKRIPVYWMETLDDLMYSLNYHAELLPAEDHLFLHNEIMSFLMNVIAALPLQSAEILLALYDADTIELKAGLVSFDDHSFQNSKTKITVKAEDGSSEEIEYKLFVNCGGQKKLELADYPFQSLVEKGIVQNATAKFENEDIFKKEPAQFDPEAIVKNSNGVNLKISGIDIDASYRTINKKGITNHFLYDISFTHTNGLRPYSYGLQACNATSLILVESWIAEIVDGKDVSKEIETITELYEDNEEL